MMDTVAPRAGAWIETYTRGNPPKPESSPLAQGRGLKHFIVKIGNPIIYVAPRAGAWIETVSGWLKNLV